MNILDYKRKARGYTFRGGYDGEGTGMGDGTGTEAGSGVADFSLADAQSVQNSINASQFANNQMADEAAMEAAGIKSAADYAAVGSQAAKPASFGFNFNAGTAAKTALGGLLGGPLGILGGLVSGISYSPATPGMPQISYGGPTGYSPGSDTTSGGFSGGPGGGSDLAGALLVAGGITAGSSATAGTGAGTGAGAASNPADPFAPYRADLAKQYAGALAPGASSNIQAMPGYSQYNTGVMQPAMMAAQRAAAAGGNLYGGGEKARLQTLGQQGYYNFMNDYMNRLAQGSGAVNNPATAVQLSQEAARDAQRIQDANQKATMSNLGFGVQTFNQLGGFDSIKNLFKGSSTSTPYSSAGYGVSNPTNYDPYLPVGYYGE